MKFILLYFLLGILMLLLTLIAHIMIADLKGYDALEWWNNHTTFVSWKVSLRDFAIVVFGIILWPITTVLFILTSKNFYKNYKRIE